MERILNATEARVHFGELLRRVKDHDETVVVERGGVPQAVVLSVRYYERLVARRSTDHWRALAGAAHRRVQEELRDGNAPSPEQLLQEGREERDHQLSAGMPIDEQLGSE